MRVYKPGDKIIYMRERPITFYHNLYKKVGTIIERSTYYYSYYVNFDGTFAWCHHSNIALLSDLKFKKWIG